MDKSNKFDKCNNNSFKFYNSSNDDFDDMVEIINYDDIDDELNTHSDDYDEFEDDLEFDDLDEDELEFDDLDDDLDDEIDEYEEN